VTDRHFIQLTKLANGRSGSPIFGGRVFPAKFFHHMRAQNIHMTMTAADPTPRRQQ
jgi:hypothetical protein